MPLAELMVLDQFLSGVPEDLRVWLKERKPESLQQAVELANDYTLARGGGKCKTTVVTAQPPVQGKPIEDRPSHSSQARTPLSEERGRTNSKGEKKCFQCNKFGHIAVNCPTREVSGASGVAKGLSAGACDEIAWNAESRKFLRRGKLDGRRVYRSCWTQAMTTPWYWPVWSTRQWWIM